MSCKAPHPVTSQRVYVASDGVGFRFEFCCRDHSPTPYLEVVMAREGAQRFAEDIRRAARDPAESAIPMLVAIDDVDRKEAAALVERLRYLAGPGWTAAIAHAFATARRRERERCTAKAPEGSR